MDSQATCENNRVQGNAVSGTCLKYTHLNRKSVEGLIELVDTYLTASLSGRQPTLLRILVVTLPHFQLQMRTARAAAGTHTYV